MNAMPQITPITEMRNTHNNVLDKLENGPVFLTQRSKAVAVIISPKQWEYLNDRIDELEAIIDILQSKVEVLSGEAEYVDVDIEQLEAQLDGVPAQLSLKNSGCTGHFWTMRM
ncbi:type II toxin-antitoxin system Phd/YefM family antitoxin [Chloroflexi bacterium TSY]|nr:type II toxin-antitoxin system Phd/YefM family antitoxin [Chloroflexi bacterium TSY]